ncbi:pyridoxamine 5'-phosphate oxidase family protein [Paenibacillus sp. P26]|nr:pyridoxamine 5'-phosphate oxidase family protein [Paenibacillus sp. P26]
MEKGMNRLSEELVKALQGEKIVTLATLDSQTNLPQLSAVSWVLAAEDGTKVRIAVGHKASTVDNIGHNPNVVLGVIGAGSYYSVRGTAEVSDIYEKTMKRASSLST